MRADNLMQQPRVFIYVSACNDNNNNVNESRERALDCKFSEG